MGCTSSSLSASEKVDILSQSPLFSLNHLDLVELASFFIVRRAPAGTVVLSEGEDANLFYVIGTGSVDLKAQNVAKEDVFLCTKSTGDFFGDESLFEVRVMWVVCVLGYRWLFGVCCLSLCDERNTRGVGDACGE